MSSLALHMDKPIRSLNPHSLPGMIPEQSGISPEHYWVCPPPWKIKDRYVPEKSWFMPPITLIQNTLNFCQLHAFVPCALWIQSYADTLMAGHSTIWFPLERGKLIFSHFILFFPNSRLQSLHFLVLGVRYWGASSSVCALETEDQTKAFLSGLMNTMMLLYLWWEWTAFPVHLSFQLGQGNP